MGRMTRAKAAEVELAEQLYVDEDAVLEPLQKPDVTTPPPDQRTPLGEIASNKAGVKGEDITQEETGKKKSAKRRKGGNKAGRQGKHVNVNALDSTTDIPPQQPLDMIPDGNRSQQSPASQAASDDLMESIPQFEQSHVPVHDVKPNTFPSNAVRLTRSQLRKVPSDDLFAVEPKSLVAEQLTRRPVKDDPALEDPFLDGGVKVPDQQVRSSPERPTLDQEPLSPSQNPVPAAVDTMPNSVQNDDGKGPTTPSKNSVNADVLLGHHPVDVGGTAQDSAAVYDILEKAAVDASTPPGSDKRVHIPASDPPTYDELEAAAMSTPNTPPDSSRKSSSFSRAQDAISAMDALEDEVEKINAEVPEVQESPEKPRSKKAAPLVRTTKASQARISLAHGPKTARAPSWGPPRQSLALNQSTAKRVASATGEKSHDASEKESAPERKETVIPHSKPRPMSLQFPTPPPPPKSTKAPTKSTFQLPGEAISAKLKAAKEARLQKETEDVKKKTFKARPAPSFANKTPIVRQTSASKAREDIINGKTLVASTGSNRPHSVATTRPATMRPASMKPTTTARSNASSKVTFKPTTSATIKPARPISGVPPRAANDLKVTKRPSTVMGTFTNKPRATLAPKPNPPAAASVTSSTSAAKATGNSAGTAKGKEVFNRAAQAKSAAEKEKREKEEAAKKARAAAAERGRQASREWAEKQRLKKLGVKPEAKAEMEVEAPQCAAGATDVVASETDAIEGVQDIGMPEYVTDSAPALALTPVAIES